MGVVKRMVTEVIGYEHRRRLRRGIRRVTKFGLSRYCPCCRASVRRFQTFGLVPRPEAQCPICRSLERHRLIFMYMTRKTDLFDGRAKRMLHVAPEPQLSQHFLQTDYIDYLSADLLDPTAMVEMDVTDIQYPDESFDVVYCSHVLEHVPDDRRAMREFYRVLKTGGWAILQVPLTAEVTFEDPGVTSPEERERLFGQHDHVRRYGPDYKDRLAQAGFSVTVDRYAWEFTDRQVTRFGLLRGEDVYLCRKQSD